MKIRIPEIWITASIMIFAVSCSKPSAVAESESEIRTDTLIFADTVGVLMGDTDYVFGTISTVTVLPAGIAVLDGITCRISMFDHRGEFLSSSGRQGSGPGEYSQPWAMCLLQGGEYFVLDHGAQRMTLLDPSFDYISSIDAFMRVPLKITSGADSMVVIKEIIIKFEDEELFGGYRIYSLNAYTGREDCVYRNCQLPMGAEEVDLRSEFCFFATDATGNVYLADYDSDEYGIEILSPDGELVRVITMDSEPREDFDIEVHALDRLPIMIPLTTESGTSNLVISAPEKHPYVTGLAVDGEDNIWVRRMGVEQSETWDVVSPDGELLRRVVLAADTSGTGCYPSLHVSSFGMVATFSLEEEFERFFTVKPQNL